MGFSIKGTIRCNMGCEYCYESTARQENPDAGKQDGYNVDKIIEFIVNNKQKIGNNPPILHGGEPLLLPKKENEKLFKFMHETFGRTSIQTNGSKIDADYIEMFKKYKTNVGVSIDGPDELNISRWMGSEEKTIATTRKIMDNIRSMVKEEIVVSIICVISKANATPDKLEKLQNWLLELKSLGIKSGRLNMIQVDFPEISEKLELSLEDAQNFYRVMAKFLRENDLKYAPFTDIVDGLLGYGHKTCVTSQCDPYHTLAERAIYGDGSQGNCLRTAKDGVVYLSEITPSGFDRVSNERYSILRQIPMSEGGCGGCRFWHVCSGHCPSTAENNDWRNKTIHCESFKTLYEEAERDLKQMMPNITLVSELKMSDNEISSLMKQNLLSSAVFAKMNDRNGAF